MGGGGGGGEHGRARELRAAMTLTFRFSGWEGKPAGMCYVRKIGGRSFAYIIPG